MVTILGASGFVGSHLAEKAQRLQMPFSAPGRDEDLSGKELGHVIYSIGLTADFRSRPFDTVEAHICKLKHLLQTCSFDSLTYLSSTRIYIHNTSASEDDAICVDPKDPFDLFNVSKLAGELLALNCGRKNVRIARLSNVYGNDFRSENFITSIVRDAVTKGKIVLRTTPDSAKDYVGIDDVTDLLLKIALEGKASIYNLASGINVDNAAILQVIEAATNCSIEYSPVAERIVFQPISVERIKQEFGYSSRATILHDLQHIIGNFQKEIAR